MDTQIEEIKRKLDIVEVINRYLPLKKRGRHFLANCPFHSEKTPSFTVSPELQIFKCFGCGKSGDILTFIQEFDKVDFRQALEDMAKLANVTLKSDVSSQMSVQRRQRLFDLNLYCSRFYNFILTSHPFGKKALEYVVGRGLTLETINRFRLGYCPPDPDLLINKLKTQKFTPHELIASGTFGHSQYGQKFYDRFKERLVFPLCDPRHRVIGFSGRVLPSTQNQNQAKYINSPETDIYHKSQTLYGLNFAKDHIREKDSVVVVEGEFDMIVPFQNGFNNFVAIKGTAFTQDQLNLLKRYTTNLILSLDSDSAGSSAARKSIQLADSLGFDIKVLDLSDRFKDPDEAVRADPEFLKNQLSQALPVWDYLIRSAVKIYGVDTNAAKKQILTLLLPYLGSISNQVIRQDYYHQLANVLSTDTDSLLVEFQKIKTTPSFPVASDISSNVAPLSTPTLPRRHQQEQQLLSLILGAKKPGKIAQKLKKKLSSAITDRLFRLVVKKLFVSPNFSAQSFRSKLPAEVQPTFDALYLEATAQDLESIPRSRRINHLLTYLLIEDLKAKIKPLSQTIAKLETLGEDQKLPQVEKKYRLLISKLSRLQSTKTGNS